MLVKRANLLLCMFNTQLKDYVKQYSGIYSPEFCNDMVKSLGEIDWKLHTFYNSITGETKSYDHELSISHVQVPLKKELDEKIWYVINQYIIQDMGYMKDWFSSWAGYTPSRFNKYDPSTQMKLHCDHIHSMFDGNRKGVPILTVLGSLNNDYEGGELILCGEQIELKAGEVLVFPSNFLYPHEVKPVKSGTRYSFVSWVW